MSFMDSVSATFSSGANKAGKVGQIAKLSLQLTSLEQQRDSMLGQLGACVYPFLSKSPELVPAAQSLVDGISRLDAEMAEIRHQIDGAKAEVAEPLAQPAKGNEGTNGAAPTQAPRSSVQDEETVVCPRCGTLVSVGFKFCGGCGLPMEEILHSAKAGGAAAEGEATQEEPEDPGTEAEALGAAEEPTKVSQEDSGPANTVAEEPQGESASEPQEPQPQEEEKPEPIESEHVSSAAQESEVRAAPEPGVEEPAPVPEAAVRSEAQPVRRHCPECGAIVGPTDKFCMICGKRLQ